MATTVPTTYILVGYDKWGTFEGAVKAWEQRARNKRDVVLVYAKPDESLADAMKNLKGPGNVILLAHGTNAGTFQWNEPNVFLPYKNLFSLLPREGIQSITIDSCFGETAITAKKLRSAPPGTLVQARIGSKTLGCTDEGQSAREITSYTKITALSLLLEMLDGTNPERLSNMVKESHTLKVGTSTSCDAETDPQKFLPHTIGLGGETPIIIDMNVTMADVSKKGGNGSLDRKAFQNAIAEVKQHFDPSDFDTSFWSFSSRQSQVGKKVDLVAAKLLNGADTSIFTLEEKRIAYALTAATLYASGEMDQLVRQSKSKASVPTYRPLMSAQASADLHTRMAKGISGGMEAGLGPLDTSNDKKSTAPPIDEKLKANLAQQSGNVSR